MDRAKRFQPKRKREVRKRNPIYYTRQWTQTSLLIRQQRPLCEICNDRESQQVHHIIPVDECENPFDPANLQALCIKCHNKQRGN